MKRNLELVKDILQAFEDSEYSNLAKEDVKLKNDYEIKEVNYHLSIMYEAGLLAESPQPDNRTGYKLTWYGHDYLEQLTNIHEE